MKYWVFDKRTNRVMGPHSVGRLKLLPGFGPEIKVAPEGSTKKQDWKAALEFEELRALFMAPPPKDPGLPGAPPSGKLPEKRPER